MSDIRNWHYIDGPRRVGPFDDLEWAALVRDGVVLPDTQVWNESLDRWAPYGSIASNFPLPELEPEPELEPIAPDLPAGTALSPEAVAAMEAEVLRDTALPRTRDCLAHSWQLYRNYTSALSGGTMLIWLMIFVGSSLPLGLGLLMPLGLTGVLQGGLFLLFLNLYRGFPAPLGTLFSGFRQGIFRNLVMRTLVGTAVNYCSLVGIVIMLRLLGLKLEEAKTPNETLEQVTAFFSALDAASYLTVVLLIAVCLLPTLILKALWIFALPLITDRRVPWAAALRISWRKVGQNPFGFARRLVGALIIVATPALLGTFLAGLIHPSAAPVAMAIIAILFSAPLFLGFIVALYDSVFFPGPEESRLREEAAQAE